MSAVNSVVEGVTLYMAETKRVQFCVLIFLVGWLCFSNRWSHFHQDSLDLSNSV